MYPLTSLSLSYSNSNYVPLQAYLFSVVDFVSCDVSRGRKYSVNKLLITKESWWLCKSYLSTDEDSLKCGPVNFITCCIWLECLTFNRVFIMKTQWHLMYLWLLTWTKNIKNVKIKNLEYVLQILILKTKLIERKGKLVDKQGFLLYGSPESWPAHQQGESHRSEKWGRCFIYFSMLFSSKIKIILFFIYKINKCLPHFPNPVALENMTLLFLSKSKRMRSVIAEQMPWEKKEKKTGMEDEREIDFWNAYVR